MSHPLTALADSPKKSQTMLFYANVRFAAEHPRYVADNPDLFTADTVRAARGHLAARARRAATKEV